MQEVKVRKNSAQAKVVAYLKETTDLTKDKIWEQQVTKGEGNAKGFLDFWLS